MPGRESKIEFSAAAAAPTGEQAAAVVAALETLLREAASGQTEPEIEPDPWLSAALLDGVSRESSPDLSEPWIKT